MSNDEPRFSVTDIYGNPIPPMTPEEREASRERRVRSGVSTPDPRYKRFQEAYLKMALHARYRPAAPNDGFGGITLTAAQLKNRKRLYEEAKAYAAEFIKGDNSCQFWIGCTDFDTNIASVFVIEAARLLCSGVIGDDVAVQLLDMAIDEIKKVQRARAVERQWKKTKWDQIPALEEEQ
jgi:hypothetical protein